MIAAELPLLARKMARREQRWLAPREKCAVHELEEQHHMRHFSAQVFVQCEGRLP